ncbi:MaoC family dehydratase [Haloquadratum walsbyi]|uniref:Acyl dehydratase n=1 Tax=Haloquadratum walsbyi J07HQW2 TaxID=1238425 RepID=U1PQ73_9EURY|nr:MaoC family dehydratase [Haloquadratum walsbyi]ERG94466.1 MAG: acyl dehydratase [Haloquadratum walsbyi J07HQW2]
MASDQSSMTDSFEGIATAWLESSTAVSKNMAQMYSNIAEANRELWSQSMDPAESTDRESGDDSIAYSKSSWTTVQSVDTVEELGVGSEVVFRKELTDSDVHAFADISGDTNRLHLDDEFASDTRFGRRIVHGTLASGLISSALARLPGMIVYLSQDLDFERPVDIGTTVEATVSIIETLDGDRYRLNTTVQTAEGTTVIDGEAVVLIDSPPATETDTDTSE